MKTCRANPIVRRIGALGERREMKPYHLRRRKDGQWEASPDGAAEALFIFENEDDLALFAKALAKHTGDTGAALHVAKVDGVRRSGKPGGFG